MNCGRQIRAPRPRLSSTRCSPRKQDCRRHGRGPSRAGAARTAVLPWTDAASAAFIEFKTSAVLVARAVGLLQTAMSDAALAAWDAQMAYARPSPAAARATKSSPAFASTHPSRRSPQRTPPWPGRRRPSRLPLPNRHGRRFDALATDAAESRIAAGAAFRSDIEAGLTLGRANRRACGCLWQGRRLGREVDPTTMPKGPGIWVPTPPAFVAQPAIRSPANGRRGSCRAVTRFVPARRQPTSRPREGPARGGESGLHRPHPGPRRDRQLLERHQERRVGLHPLEWDRI